VFVTTRLARAVARQELGEFLRSRRQRRSPADAGLPAIGRRRTPGLRREEVAQLSGVSVSWYTWLEQGRDIRASAQVLRSVAQVLGLSEPETDYLFALAGATEGRSPAEPESASVPPGLRHLLAALEPSPAYVADARWDVLAWNRAEAALVTDFARLPERERNMLWVMLTDPSVRRLLPSWEREAQHALALFRAAAGRHPGDERFQELVGMLSATSAEFREWWPRHAVVAFRPAHRGFHHPGAGELALEYVKLQLVERAGVFLVAHLAAPGSPEHAALSALAAEAAAPAS
jgi:transcriptional regulator with XRE-family HTH domain